MAATDKPKPHGLVEYLIYGTRDAEKRLTSQELNRVTGPWVPTTLLNSCVAPPAPKKKVQYRLNFKEDKLQFRGHVDVTAATSPVHAFTLLPPFWLDFDDSWLTDVWDGAAFAVARAAFDSTNGHVTLTWPAA